MHLSPTSKLGYLSFKFSFRGFLSLEGRNPLITYSVQVLSDGWMITFGLVFTLNTKSSAIYSLFPPNKIVFQSTEY